MNICTLCKSQYSITEADRAFYQKMDVPAPTLCPVCRFRRKAVWRNERTLYQGICHLCKSSMVSMYAPDSHAVVYCRACYYSDRWDPLQYGRGYDPARPFFEQCAKLFAKVPKAATVVTNPNVNSEYQNWAGRNKDCYMVFNGGFSEKLFYSRGMRSCRDTLDCYYGVNAELSYECVNIFDSSRTRYSQNVRSCVDSWFLRDCTGCTNCFGCINLRYKDYYFFNEPIEKDEYQRRVNEIIGSHSGMQEVRKQWEDLSASLPFKENHNMKSEDCSGDYIIDSKNCAHSFEIDKDENCSYNYFTKTAKDAYDCIGFGFDSELLYENVAAGFSHRIIGSIYAENCTELEYSQNMRASSSCIGCVGLEKAQFGILNTIYPEYEYRALHERIVRSLKKEGQWGEFFPILQAPFSYNETIAHDYYPMTKEETLAQGYRWQDALPGTTGKETAPLDSISDHIRDVPDSIIREVFACVSCGRNYKIIAQELALYRQIMVPVPRRCFSCRHTERLRRRGPMQLYERHCSQCAGMFRTALRQDVAPIIYCDTCYSATVM